MIVPVHSLLLLAAWSQQPIPLEQFVPLKSTIPLESSGLDSSGFHGTPELVLQRYHIALDEPTVLAALRSDNPEVRVAVAEIAAQHWPKDAPPAIREAMRKESVAWYRIRMAAALARLGDPLGRKTLVNECHGTTEPGSVRMAAATALIRNVQDDSCSDSVLHVLQSATEVKDTSAKEQALELAPVLIRRVDRRQSQRIFDLLTNALGDPWPVVRITASITLERLGDVRAIPILKSAIDKEQDKDCLRVMNTSLKALQTQ
jgi:HEAT repeat protein